MKYIAGLVVMLIASIAVAGAHADFTLIKLSRSAADLKPELQQQQQQSERLHQKMFVQVVAGWCSHCRKLNSTLGTKRMKDAFQGTYIVQLDADEWKDQLASIGIRLDGIPAFYQIDKNGLATNYTINGGAWGEDTVANMAPPLKAYFAAAK